MVNRLKPLLALIFLLQACALPLPATQPEEDAIFNAARETLTAEAEATAQAASPTPSPSPTPTTTPTDTPQPTSTLIPANVQGAAACVPIDSPTDLGIVTNVIDGETIEVLIDETVYPVRYIGINASRLEASAANAALVQAQIVRLVMDVSDKDKSGNLLRYVFVGDLFINYVMVRQGFATAAPTLPDVTCAYTFSTAEEEARALGIGLWAPTATPASP